jgi:hypothetical protein
MLFFLLGSILEGAVFPCEVCEWLRDVAVSADKLSVEVDVSLKCSNVFHASIS